MGSNQEDSNPAERAAALRKQADELWAEGKRIGGQVGSDLKQRSTELHTQASTLEKQAIKRLETLPAAPKVETAGPVGGTGPFALGSETWPGTSKLLEEMGELTQVLGKLIAIGGNTAHWSGDLRKMLVDELADVRAALSFFALHNLTPEEQGRITARFYEKSGLYEKWHKTPGQG